MEGEERFSFLFYTFFLFYWIKNGWFLAYRLAFVWKTLPFNFKLKGSKGGAVVRALASHQCGPGSNPGVDMWVEFVVGSLPCSERFFSGYSGFPLSSKTNTSKFQFDLERTDTEKRVLKLLGRASWVNKLHLHFCYFGHGFCFFQLGQISVPRLLSFFG